MHLEDRRRKRSQDPLIALHYQLSRARQDGSLEALVLADTSGVVVAGAGAWAACEEIAAYAPLLAQEEESGSPRIVEMRGEVQVRHLHVGGQEVLLCARHSEKTVDPWVFDLAMKAATEGVTRILAA